MNKLIVIAALVFGGCGRGFEPVSDEPEALPIQPTTTPPPPATPVTLPPAAPKCIVDENFGHLVWECETVSALEIVSIKVTNANGSSPWTTGQPRVTAVMRNTLGTFINYPSLQVAASAPSLQPSHPRDSLYGMIGCGVTELSMQFKGAAPSGAPVTFTAIPAHINGDQCALSRPPITLTVTAP